MTTPTPRPVTPKGAQAVAEAGILQPVSGSGKSKFGLPAGIAEAPVNVGGLLPVKARGKQVTAEEVLDAFAHASPSTIAAIQRQLMLGGFYTGDATPNYGVINPEDLDAMAKATTRAAQTTRLENGQLVGGNLQEYLGRQAQFGKYTGIAAAVGQAKPRVVQKADPLQVSSLVEQAFRKMTGRKPTDAERAGFIVAYDAAYTHLQNSNYDSAEDAIAPSPEAQGYSTAPPDYLPVPEPKGGVFGGLAGAISAASTNVLNQGMAQRDVANLQAQPTADTSVPGTVVQQDFDPASFAEQYVREHATAETGAHDIAGTFDMFLSLLAGLK